MTAFRIFYILLFFNSNRLVHSLPTFTPQNSTNLQAGTEFSPSASLSSVSTTNTASSVAGNAVTGNGQQTNQIINLGTSLETAGSITKSTPATANVIGTSNDSHDLIQNNLNQTSNLNSTDMSVHTQVNTAVTNNNVNATTVSNTVVNNVASSVPGEPRVLNNNNYYTTVAAPSSTSQNAVSKLAFGSSSISTQSGTAVNMNQGSLASLTLLQLVQAKEQADYAFTQGLLSMINRAAM